MHLSYVLHTQWFYNLFSHLKYLCVCVCVCECECGCVFLFMKARLFLKEYMHIGRVILTVQLPMVYIVFVVPQH